MSTPEHQLLPKRQYRAYHSVETAVTAFHNNFVHNVDQNGKVSVLVLLDLSSAFDTVDHIIFLDILEQRFGVTSLALDWYLSYLCVRTQIFQVVSDRSIAFVVDCSVPQGLVLGPLKFVVYTEDVPAVNEQHRVDHDLYANDTQPQIIPPSHASPAQSRTSRTASINKSCASKRLQRNPMKSEIIWF